MICNRYARVRWRRRLQGQSAIQQEVVRYGKRTGQPQDRGDAEGSGYKQQTGGPLGLHVWFRHTVPFGPPSPRSTSASRAITRSSHMKVGVVGLGMGSNHVRGFQQTDGVEA